MNDLDFLNQFIPKSTTSPAPTIDEIMRAVEGSENPYFDTMRFLANGEIESLYEPFGYADFGRIEHFFKVRFDLMAQFSYAIPDNEAIDLISSYKRIVEVGAGSGYWAHLVSKTGADVVAFDDRKYENLRPPDKIWFDVQEGDEKISSEFPDRALFLCWPPLNSKMAYRSLRAYKGDTVIYVGEGKDGCTADKNFFNLLGRLFVEVKSLVIPRWPAVNDYLAVYERMG